MGDLDSWRTKNRCSYASNRKTFYVYLFYELRFKTQRMQLPSKRGRVKKKAYIGRMVKEGFSDAEIVDSFRKKYGGLIE